MVDPLRLALAGDESAEGLLPQAGFDADMEGRQDLEGLIAGLNGLAGLDGEEEVDRLALLSGLRRSMPPAGPAVPLGARAVEAHLLAVLPRAAAEPRMGAELLASVVDAAPAFLGLAREGCLGAAPDECRVALAASQRLPTLLDLLAAAAGSLPISRLLRERLEAGLGALLAAAAEDAGVLVRKLLPAAAPRPLPPGLQLAGGWDQDRLREQAEALLATQVLEADDDADEDEMPADVAPTPATIERAWASALDRASAWCPQPGPPSLVFVDTPAWLRPLVPALALAPTGPLSTGSDRLLVDRDTAAPGLASALLRMELTERLPLAWRRARPRLARILGACPDSAEGWRANALEAGPGAGAQNTRRELAWRAALALCALEMVGGRMDVEMAADMIAVESGLPIDRARLQAMHLSVAPIGALTFIAGRAEVRAAVERLGGDPGARARVLGAGQLPAFAIAALGSPGIG